MPDTESDPLIADPPDDQPGGAGSTSTPTPTTTPTADPPDDQPGETT